MEWARLFEDMQYRFVGQATIVTDAGTKYRVSTVWLGMDHGYHPDSRPVIFETMVFIDEAGSDAVSWVDHYQDRYCTEAEAKAGHQAMVDMVSGACTVAELVEHDAFT